jgi:hypothetical protein
MQINIIRKEILVLFAVALISLPVKAQAQKITTTSACRLFADIENVSSVLSYIPKGTELGVIEYSGDYALVEYDGTKGWIRADKTSAPSAQELSQVQNQYNETQDYKSYNPNQIADRYTILIDKYGYSTGKAIYEHKIWKGIDNNMVKDSWGKPLQVSREINSSGTIEIWTYRKSWLLLKNGILTEWGPNK